MYCLVHFRKKTKKTPKKEIEKQSVLEMIIFEDIRRKAMRTWNDYKEYVKRIDPENKKTLEEIEAISDIVNALVEQRNNLGISQRDLAMLCGLPQSSVAMIESYVTMPKLDTLIKIMQPLGLKLSVAQTKEFGGA